MLGSKIVTGLVNKDNNTSPLIAQAGYLDTAVVEFITVLARMLRTPEPQGTFFKVCNTCLTRASQGFHWIPLAYSIYPKTVVAADLAAE